MNAAEAQLEVAAQPSRSSPTPRGSSSQSTFANANAPRGIKTKLATRASTTNRALRSGSKISDRATGLEDHKLPPNLEQFRGAIRYRHAHTFVASVF